MLIERFETYGFATSPGILPQEIAPKKAPMDTGMITL